MSGREGAKGCESNAGLCASCRYSRAIESARGSNFIMCERSATDAAFAKYPRLPVLQCAGYEKDEGHLAHEQA